MFLRRVEGGRMPLFRCRRIAWLLVTVLLPPPRRRRGAGHMLKLSFQGMKGQVPAVSRIAFGFTSGEA